MPASIIATPAAVALIRQLKQLHGPLLFHQSGGCCDGSVPLCLRQSDFRIGSRDVLMGLVDDTPFYVGAAQYEYLAKSELILDVIPGNLDSFSLEAGEGVRFISRTSGICR